jgi:hypothetical protein
VSVGTFLWGLKFGDRKPDGFVVVGPMKITRCVARSWGTYTDDTLAGEG